MEDKGVTFLELKLEHQEKFVLTVKHTIILLLGIIPDVKIETRTLFYKELFLFYKEMLESKKFPGIAVHTDPKFVPYIYGPFSFQVASDLGSLVYSGDVVAHGKVKNQAFEISDKGYRVYEYILKNLSRSESLEEFLEELKRNRKGWDQLGSDGIKNRVKRIYPDYFLWIAKNANLERVYGAALLTTEEPPKKTVDPKYLKYLPSVGTTLEEISGDEWIKKLNEEYGEMIWARSYKE